MTPFSQLQLIKSKLQNNKANSSSYFHGSFGKLYNPSPLPFCLSRLGKWKWKTVPGEKLVCSRGCWLPLGSRCLPAWLAGQPCASTASSACAGQCFTRLWTARVPPSRQTSVGEGSAGATGAEPVLKRSLLFYLPCSAQGKRSTQEKGNLLRGGSRESVSWRVKKKGT